MEYVIGVLLLIVVILAIRLEMKKEKISQLRRLVSILAGRDNGVTESYAYAAYYSMLFKQALLEIKDLRKLCDDTYAVYKNTGGLQEQEKILHIARAKCNVSEEFPRKQLDEAWLSFKDIKKFNLIFKKKYDDLKRESVL